MIKIRNYEELMLEKARLQGVLLQQKEMIREEVKVIRENLAPLFKLISFFHSSKTGNDSLGKRIANAGTQSLAGNILSKVGWVARLVVPVLLTGATGTLVERLMRRFSKNPLKQR